jgi:predicted O-methyltransferase YrrM
MQPLVKFEQNPGYTFAHEWYKQLTESARIASTHEVLKTKIDPSENHTILEIGVFEGASSCWWSDNLLDSAESRLFSIDPFTGSEEHHANPENYPTLNKIESIARANIAKSKNASKVNIIKGASWDVFHVIKEFTDDKIDILYIDGAHDRFSVTRDVALYWPLVKNGGLVIFDDYPYPDTQVAVNSFLNMSEQCTQAYGLSSQLWVVKKV